MIQKARFARKESLLTASPPRCETLLRRGFAFDKAFQALQLVVEHPIDFGRPLLHAAADVAADDIAQRDIGAALSRFQCPAERAVDALRLQRAERAAQTQSLAGAA